MSEQQRRGQNKKGAARPPEHPLPHPVERHGRGTAIAIAAAVVVLILAIVGIIGYPIYVGPFHKTIISVDNTNIRMDYFLKRMKLSGSDAISLLTSMTNDQIIKLAAPNLVGAASPQDIDQALHQQFAGQSGNVSANAQEAEAEFKEWYRQLLNNSGLTDAEYRDIVMVAVLKSHLQTYLEARMPTTAEHAHIYLITFETQKAAEKARARWAAGENFTALAKELSLDTELGAKGGELGWFPKGGILIPQLEFEAFDIATGNVSDPLPIFQENAQQPDGTTAPAIVGYNLLLVTERATRQLDANALEVYKGHVVDNWLTSVRNNHTIAWHGLNGDAFDSETNAWLNYQIAKSKPPSSTSQQSGR